MGGCSEERTKDSWNPFRCCGHYFEIAKKAQVRGLMFDKSKNSDGALDHPLASGVLAKARRVAESYRIVLVCEHGKWHGRGLEMPSVFGEGDSPNECVADTRDALTAAVATMLEGGQVPPSRKDSP